MAYSDTAALELNVGVRGREGHFTGLRKSRQLDHDSELLLQPESRYGEPGRRVDRTQFTTRRREKLSGNLNSSGEILVIF